MGRGPEKTARFRFPSAIALLIVLVALAWLPFSARSSEQNSAARREYPVTATGVTAIPFWAGLGGYCTDYVWARWPQIHPGERLLIDGPYGGDAWAWYPNAVHNGMSTGQMPEVGSVAVWGIGVGGSGSLGHVAVVEKVYSSISFQVSEMNWSCGRSCIDHRNITLQPGINFIYATNHSPIGNVDSVTWVAPLTVAVRGWAADPDYHGSINVRFFADGVYMGQALAAYARPDVGPRGFNQVLSGGVFSPGRQHSVCAYGIDPDGIGTNSFLGCGAVYMPSDTIGALEGASGAPGGLRFWGWTIDPKTSSPITVHAYLDGRIAAAAQAKTDRPDVARSYPGYGPDHGYSAIVAAAPGTHTLCVYGINTGAGANSSLGCRTIQISDSPVGHLDSVAIGSDRQLHVSGWVIEPDTSNSIQVNLYVNDQPAVTEAASGERADVGAAYPDYGPDHGYQASTLASPGENDVCAYGIDVHSGAGSLLGCQAAQNSLANYPPAPAPAGDHYYWPWFDSGGGNDWLMMANNSTGVRSFNLNMNGRNLNLGLAGDIAMQPGQLSAVDLRRVAGGPVVLTSAGGAAAVSQRTLWAGSSLEEVPGIKSTSLSSHYFWPLYDTVGSGTADWVMLANSGLNHADKPQGTVSATINIGGQSHGPYTIAPGQTVAKAFPGITGSPVEVSSSGDVIASQRVLTGSGTAFNELPGISASQLSSDYLWTWYDQKGDGMEDWVMVANPSASQDMYYEIDIGGKMVLDDAAAGPVLPGKSIAPQLNGQNSGPLEVRTFSDVAHTQTLNAVASQRINFGSSFEEVPGSPSTTLAGNFVWSWYDMRSTGASDWILIANPGSSALTYEIKIGGRTMPASSANPGTIAANSVAIAVFPGVAGGPVEVSASGNVLASQRIIWNGHLNEVLGTVTN